MLSVVNEDGILRETTHTIRYMRWRSPGTSNLPWDMPRVKGRYVYWIKTLG